LHILQELQDLEAALKEVSDTLASTADEREQRRRELATKRHAEEMEAKAAAFEAEEQKAEEGLEASLATQAAQLKQQQEDEWAELTQQHAAESAHLKGRHATMADERRAAAEQRRGAFDAAARADERAFADRLEREAKELLEKEAEEEEGTGAGAGAGEGAGGGPAKKLREEMLQLKRQIAERQLALIDQAAAEEATVRVNAWSAAEDKLTTNK
jgi:hypothetical protein